MRPHPDCMRKQAVLIFPFHCPFFFYMKVELQNINQGVHVELKKLKSQRISLKFLEFLLVQKIRNNVPFENAVF